MKSCWINNIEFSLIKVKLSVLITMWDNSCMENGNPQTDLSQTQNVENINQQNNIHKPTNSLTPKPLVIAGVFLGFVAMGVGGFLLGMQVNKDDASKSDNITSSQPDKDSEENSLPALEPVANALPSGWRYELGKTQNNANDCVTFALPPMEEPYIHPDDGELKEFPVTQDEGSGRFWHLGGATYPNMLSQVLNDGEEYKQSMAVYSTETAGSGYISQAVSVSCVPNNNRFLNNDQLLTTLNNKLAAYNAASTDGKMQILEYKIKSQNSIERWGNQVLDLTVSEDGTNMDYTLLVTPDYIYEVKVFGESEDSFVQQTAIQIFENLKFK